jgi:hypothetical protein
MSMPTEAVEALHTITAELKAEHERRDTWLADFDAKTDPMLEVTRAEAERIFADRIAAHESRLKELGWTRTIRVEPAAAVVRADGSFTDKQPI